MRKYLKYLQSKLPGGFLLTGIVALVVYACEERYYPDIGQKYERVLVVDGMISNDPGPYTVTLSMSTSVSGPEIVPVSGWQVKISEQSGPTETLTETETGVYTTADGGIQGIPGKYYRIELMSPSGNSYQSNYEKLPDAIDIDSLYAQLEYRSVSYFPYNLPGYEFYLDTRGIPTDSTWLMWRLAETFEYNADFKVYYYYDGVLHRVFRNDSLQTCWRTSKIPDIQLQSLQGFSVPEVEQYPLLFVGTDSRRLHIRYSLLATQYNISHNAFTYWKNVKEQNFETGDLYSKQPFQVRGNVFAQDQPGTPVFGYFMAAGLSRKRIFVNRPKPPVQTYISHCSLTEVDYLNYGLMLMSPPPVETQFVTVGPYGGRALPVQSCVDCRQKGGSIEKPDFWIDN